MHNAGKASVGYGKGATGGNNFRLLNFEQPDNSAIFMPVLRKAITHIALLLLALPLWAQQPVHRPITENDGLPDNEIYYLYQDRKGIIWISTNSGLCRYNGQSFQHFSHPQLKAKSTGGIQEDSFGRIWGNNFAGQLFYVSNDSLVLVQLPGMPTLSSSAPFAIGPQNQLVVTSEKGALASFIPRHQQAIDKPFYTLDTILHPYAQNPFFDSQGRLWACIGTGATGDSSIVFCYSNTQKQYFQRAAQYKSKPKVNSFFLEWDKRIWMFERYRSSMYQQEGNTFTAAPLPNMPGLLLIEQLQNGGLALCTNNGLYLANGLSSDQPLSPPLFPGQTISAFCQDNKGNLWVGTLAEGIYFIPAQHLTRAIPTKTGVDYNKITALSSGPNNQLMVGFLNGELGILDSQSRYQTLQPANPLSNKLQGLYYSPVLQMVTWYSNQLYQSSYSPSQRKWTTAQSVGDIAKDMSFIPAWNAALVATSTDITVISLDRQPIASKITSGWLKQYDTTVFFIKNIMPWPLQSLVLSKERGRAVYYDEATETFWGADKNGITLYRQTGPTSLLLNNSPIVATSFYKQGGTLWAGTFSQGLIKIQAEKAVRQYTIKDGLVSNTIYQILGSHDHLWISTDKGLQYFDTATQRFAFIDKTWGLPTYKINGMALANGQLYISTPKGLLYLPDQPITHTEMNPPPQVYLKGIYCNGQWTDTSQSRFDTQQNDFMFTVETPLYNNRYLLHYRYRLHGVDKGFSSVGLDNAVFEYKSLRSGSYRFEVVLMDAMGNVVGHPIVYSFTIRPPFYKTAWFITLCLSLLASIIYFGVRRRIRAIQKREQEKLQLSQMETALKQSQLSGIKAQMNPHFMFNALNSIQEFILLNDKKQANLYMGQFADLMRMILDMSNQNEVALEDEIKMLELYLSLEALRFEERFSYAIHIDETVNSANIYLPAMLIQPHVENAFKHGLLHKTGDKRLSISFAMDMPNVLRCTIVDNGIGRKRSGEINEQRRQKHTSFATGAIQRRLELLNHGKQPPISIAYTDLVDAHGHAQGTQVTIVIPV
jgi:sensor histidine kinase YesM/ligand-binding sensor domain-containing protein